MLNFGLSETNCRIARNMGILLMNSNCFAFYFQQHSSYVCSDIYLPFFAIAATHLPNIFQAWALKIGYLSTSEVILAHRLNQS